MAVGCGRVLAGTTPSNPRNRYYQRPLRRGLVGSGPAQVPLPNRTSVNGRTGTVIAAGAALRKSFLNRRQRSRTRHLGRISEPPRPSVMDDPDSWLPSRDSNPDQRLQRLSPGFRSLGCPGQFGPASRVGDAGDESRCRLVLGQPWDYIRALNGATFIVSAPITSVRPSSLIWECREPDPLRVCRIQT